MSMLTPADDYAHPIGPEPNFNRPLAPVGTTPQKSEKGTKK